MHAQTLSADRRSEARTFPAGLSVATLAVGLLGWLVVQQLLLWSFLGFAASTLAAGALVGAGLLTALRRWPGWSREVVGWRVLFPLFALALLIFVLGGEGRLVYANTDWQVRGAVLRDLVAYPWPFVYADEGGLALRLPLGLYLLPAIAGKLFGQRAAEFAMLVQNAAVLTALLALGRGLFATTRRRLIALAVVVGFSGMDVVGAMMTGRPLLGHIERWAGGLQYSSHVTQAFWAPQHAFAGWIGALAYLLWRDGQAPAVAVLALAPLLALLSPFGLIGTLPFAAHVGFTLLRERRLGRREIVASVTALTLAIPTILYLNAAGDTVGGAFEPPQLKEYYVFAVVEIAPLLWVLWLTRGAHRFGMTTVAITAAILVLAPFGHIGPSFDFVMRASIPALLVVSLEFAHLLATTPATALVRRARAIAALSLAIGLVTPATEVLRALSWPRAPAARCSYLGVVPGGAATYVARLDRLPAVIRPVAPTRIAPHDPARCWASPWPDPID